MSDFAEDFSVGLIEGFTATMQSNLEARNRQRTAQLQAELKAREKQLGYDNMAQAMMDIKNSIYPDIPDTDPAEGATVIEGPEYMENINGRVFDVVARAIQGGMPADDAVQLGRFNFEQELDQIGRRKNALMMQAYAHAAQGDLDAAREMFARGMSHSISGLAYVPRAGSAPGQPGTIDIYDERTRELVDSTPFTADLPEWGMMQPSAVPQYVQGRLKDDLKSRREAARLGLQYAQNERAQAAAQRQHRDDARSQLIQGLISSVAPGAKPEEFFYEMSDDRQERYVAVQEVADEMADSAAQYDQPTEQTTAMSTALNDLFSGEMLNERRDALDLGEINPDGSHWVRYKGQKFRVSPQLFMRFQAIRSRMQA